MFSDSNDLEYYHYDEKER